MLRFLLVVVVAISLGIANSLDVNLLTNGNTKFITDFLKLHNSYRKSANKNLPDLEWDNNLATLASKTAR